MRRQGEGRTSIVDEIVTGNIVGGMLGMVLQYELLLVVSGLVDAGALAIFVLVLAPRLNRAMTMKI